MVNTMKPSKPAMATKKPMPRAQAPKQPMAQPKRPAAPKPALRKAQARLNNAAPNMNPRKVAKVQNRINNAAKKPRGY